MAESVIDILKSVGAILTDDHFVFTSQKHSSVYVNKDALYPHTEKTSQVCKMFADHCKDMDIDTVVAPALGGIILSQWTAYHLSKLKNKEIYGVYAEKAAGKTFAFTRGYDTLVSGKNILILEDVCATGGSLKRVITAVQEAKGNIVAAGVMVNRDPSVITSEMMGVPFFWLGEIHAQAYDEVDMPDELRKKPINITVGHGRKYLQDRDLL